MKSKEKIVTFKASSEYIELIGRLGATLKLDRSKTIRLALDEAVEKYISKKLSRRYFYNGYQNLPCHHHVLF